MIKPIYKHMILGTAYYPEHWDKSIWEDDMLRMRAHGINLVRIGDFSWSKHEYKEGEFTLDYFDEFLGLCAKHGMDVIFCTPTAAPPAWLTHKYPEALNADKEGNLYYGPRRHYNYNSPVYKKLCQRIAEKLAEHYGKFDIIVGWQIDNELNCDLSEFYSQSDHEAFREYLKKKFVTLDNLNDSLGMTFWNRTYSDWEQVTLNKKCVGGAVNPHLALEEKRFFSESAIAFCEIQVKAIRKHIPEGKFITTNGLFANLDYNRLLECGLDFITYDSYPNFAFDLMKDGVDGFKDRKWSWNLMWTRSVSPVFGIMEQQAGANGWSTRMETPAPKPGQMRLWTMQSIAHGADMVTYFRWRTSPIGCEIYWHGLNDYANTESRRMRELQTIGEEVARLEPIRGTIYKADVAVLKDYSNAWDAASDCWHGRIDSYSDNSWFEATQISHTPADFRFIRPETTLEELSAYKLLVYPHPAILESQTAGLLKEYVSNGGVLVCGARTGYKDAFGRCPMRPMPGIISEWCGATVRDYTLVGPEDGEIIIDWDDLSLPAPVFNEVLDVHDAEVLGHFKGSYYDGAPAFCRKALGAGYVYYLGSCFSAGMARAIIEKTGRLAPYSHVLELSNTMELAVRSDGSRDYLFVLNYGGEAAKITLKRTLKELLSGQMLDGIIEMLPYGVAVFELE